MTRSTNPGWWEIVGWPFLIARLSEAEGYPPGWYVEVPYGNNATWPARGGQLAAEEWLREHRLVGPHRTRQDLLLLLESSLRSDPLPLALEEEPPRLIRIRKGHYRTPCGRALASRNEKGEWEVHTAPEQPVSLFAGWSVTLRMAAIRAGAAVASLPDPSSPADSDS